MTLRDVTENYVGTSTRDITYGPVLFCRMAGRELNPLDLGYEHHYQYQNRYEHKHGHKNEHELQYITQIIFIMS